MRPPPDPVDALSPPAEADRVAARLARFREAVSGGAAAERFALAVLDQFEMRPAGLAVPLTTLTQRFLDHVLPNADEVRRLPPTALAEYANCDPDRPDPGRLTAAYGLARLRLFGADRRLVYRTGGYRGRAGSPLADHLLAVILAAAPADS